MPQFSCILIYIIFILFTFKILCTVKVGGYLIFLHFKTLVKLNRMKNRILVIIIFCQFQIKSMLNTIYGIENQGKGKKKEILLVNANTQMNSVVFCHFSKKRRGRRHQKKPTR